MRARDPMKYSRPIILILLIACLAGAVSADTGVPQTEETQGINTMTAMQLLGTATEDDSIVMNIDDGYHTRYPPAPPIAPTSVVYTSAYLENTLADQGSVSYTKSVSLDTRGMATENQYNLETDRIVAFVGSDTGRMTSEETLLLDGVGAGTDTWTTITCPLAASDYYSIIPPFCNIVEQGSEVDITSGMLATETQERFIMGVVPDPTVGEIIGYGMDWPWPVSDPGTEMNYDFTLAGIGSYPATGSASVSMQAHVQESRNVIESYTPHTGWTVTYPQSSDIVYSEQTTASGIIDLFQKDMYYTSKFTGPAGTWIVINPPV